MKVSISFELETQDVKNLISLQLVPREKLLEAIRKSTFGGPDKPELIKAVYEEPKPAPKKRGRKPKEPKPEKTVIDVGKIMACHNAGRSVEWIADEMGIATEEIEKVIQEVGNNELHD